MKKGLRTLIVVLTIVGLSFVPTIGYSEGQTKKSLEGVTIRVVLNAGPIADAPMALIPDFEKLTGAKVIPEVVPFADLFAKALIDLTTHTGNYDVICTWTEWFPAFVPYLYPLDEFLQNPKVSMPDYDLEDFIQAPLDGFRWKGKLYVLPHYANTQMMCYRKDIFNDPKEKAAFKLKYGYELKPAETWDEFRDQAEFFYRPPKLYGFTAQLKRGSWIVYTYLPFLWSFGGEILDEQMKPVINSKEAVEALKFMIEISKFATPGSLENMAGDSVAEHQVGITPINLYIWADWAPRMYDPEQTPFAGKFGFLPMPRKVRHAMILGCWGLSINADSKNKGAAFKFIQYVTSKDVAERYIEAGGVQLRKSTLTNPKFVKMYPFYTALMDCLQYTLPLPKTPKWAEEMSEVLGVELSEALIGSKTPQKALDDTQDKFVTIMKK